MSFSLIDEADCTTPTRRGVGANDSWHVFLPSDAMHTTVCYFGADIPGAGQVSSAQWNDFVEVSVRVIFNIHNTRSTGSCVVLQRRLQELNKLLTLSAGGQKHIATKLESFTLSETTGYWKGHRESTFVLTVIHSKASAPWALQVCRSQWHRVRRT